MIIEYPDGTKKWYLNDTGILHREDGPSVIRGDGSFFWYYNGKNHRIGGPAVYDVSAGIKQWMVHGKLHRIGGPAYVETKTGLKEWYQRGKLHRVGGPAVEGTINEWWVNGIQHRIDGPAIESVMGNQWWIKGQNFTKQITEWLSANNFPNYTVWTNKEKVFFKLRWE